MSYDIVSLYQKVESRYNTNCEYFRGYYSRQVFNQDQEKTLADYLLKCASIYFGLLPEVRKLAYTCAVKFEMPNIPVSWHRNKEAGANCC